MGTAHELALGVFALVGAVAAHLLALEAHAWLPRLRHAIVILAVRIVPKESRARFAEEWASFLDEMPGEISKLASSLGFFVGALGIAFEYWRVVSSDKRRVAAKRFFDVALIIFGLPLVILIMVPIALLIAGDGHSPFHARMRIGRFGRTFPCLKFRTTEANGENEPEGLLANSETMRAEWNETHKLSDPRFTKIGRFLRSTGLDELPQVFNVLLGDMSIVGPRPIGDEELPMYGDRADVYLTCLPGITGLWQVSSRDEISNDERVALDIEYAKHGSILNDIKIMLLTIPIALGSHDDAKSG